MPARAPRSRKSVQPVQPTQGLSRPKDCHVRTGSGNSGASADQGVSNTCEGRSILTTVPEFLEKLREYEARNAALHGFMQINLFSDGSGFVHDSYNTKLFGFDMWPEALEWLEKEIRK